jgi:hypothetical protein
MDRRSKSPDDPDILGGFFALITGAVAQRFLATEIEVVGEEIEASEAEMLEQIEALGRQLQTLEATVRRRARVRQQ